MAIELTQLSEVYSHSLDQKHFQGYLDEFYYRFYRRFTFNRWLLAWGIPQLSYAELTQ